MKFKYSSTWTTSLLDDVTDRGSGHTPSQSIPEYWNGKIKWVSLADSSKLDNLFISNTDKTISELGIKNSSAVKHPAGTVILSRDAGVGKSAILKEEMAVSQHFIVWKCFSKNIVNNIYLYYWLQMMKPEFERMAVGSTIKTIGLPYFKKLEITYPPLSEQCKIAEILGVWDEAIDLLEKLVVKTRSRKQGLMQQLLTGKRRFKEFEGSEWKEYQLSQIADITMGTSPKSESYNSNKEGLPLLQGNADVKNRVSAPRIWTNEVTKECFPTDIIMSVRAPVGTIAISLHHACIGRGIAAIKAKSKTHPNYLYQLLLFSEPKWAELSQGSTFDSVNSADIKSRVFSIPLIIPEQEKIAAVLSAADEEIATLEKQLAAYKRQKLGLMQQLLTGKIRVGII